MTRASSPTKRLNMDWVALVKDGGIAGAIIVVVLIFTKVLAQTMDLVKGIATQFTETLRVHQEQADTRLKALTVQFHESHMATQETVNNLVREQIEANTKMTVAIEGLERAVTELQKKG